MKRNVWRFVRRVYGMILSHRNVQNHVQKDIKKLKNLKDALNVTLIVKVVLEITRINVWSVMRMLFS